MTKTPWMKWYPADWRADPRLRMCSYAARGLWADLITLMHEGEPYGLLLVNGIAPTIKQIASLLGGSEREVKSLIDELESAGVFSRTDAGVIYSRRMMRDKAKADKDRENGGRGGNPTLKPGDKRPENRGVNPPANPPVGSGDKAQKLEARVSDASASGDRSPKPPDPVKALWDGALVILGDTPQARKLVGKLRREHGDAAVLGAIIETRNEVPSDAPAYFVACCQRRQANGRSSGHANALDILAQAAIDFDERQGDRGDFEAPH
jgi:DNA-binding Lrp family transcriptional regulator